MENLDAWQTWRAMVRASSTIGRVLRQTVGDLGLTGIRMPVLILLAEAGEEGMKLSELGEKLYVSNGNVTGLIDRLEEVGLVMREAHPSDRRAVLAKLTPKGRNLIDSHLPIFEDRVDEILLVLTEAEQEVLYSSLTRISDRAQSLLREPASPDHANEDTQ